MLLRLRRQRQRGRGNRGHTPARPAALGGRWGRDRPGPPLCLARSARAGALAPRGPTPRCTSPGTCRPVCSARARRVHRSCSGGGREPAALCPAGCFSSSGKGRVPRGSPTVFCPPAGKAARKAQAAQRAVRAGRVPRVPARGRARCFTSRARPARPSLFFAVARRRSLNVGRRVLGWRVST